uniref:Uncharacterized protein LOC104249973 n=1 Tax=Nicotiana sylvestris TaxID=4096 RepID=A0A1U7Z095_NICSY|nr:PREDICTED: uncharacterized protein LOC104249973 [Nicotiana sylvestris]
MDEIQRMRSATAGQGYEPRHQTGNIVRVSLLGKLHHRHKIVLENLGKRKGWPVVWGDYRRHTGYLVPLASGKMLPVTVSFHCFFLLFLYCIPLFFFFLNLSHVKSFFLRGNLSNQICAINCNFHFAMVMDLLVRLFSRGRRAHISQG